MKAIVGAHSGEHMEVLMLNRPDYINWLLPYDAKLPLAVMKEEALRLVQVFDAKPFRTPCSTSGCTQPVTRWSVYKHGLAPICWCADCDPHSLGAQVGKLRIGRTYRDALAHVTSNYGERRADFKTIIRRLAMTKGLGQRVDDLKAIAFFA